MRRGQTGKARADDRDLLSHLRAARDRSRHDDVADVLQEGARKPRFKHAVERLDHSILEAQGRQVRGVLLLGPQIAARDVHGRQRESEPERDVSAHQRHVSDSHLASGA
eukprot:2117997-Rhodomonas_salina.5